MQEFNSAVELSTDQTDKNPQRDCFGISVPALPFLNKDFSPAGASKLWKWNLRERWKIVDCEMSVIAVCSLFKSQNEVVSLETLVATELLCVCYTYLLPLQLYLLKSLQSSGTCHRSSSNSCSLAALLCWLSSSWELSWNLQQPLWSGLI